MVVEDTEIQALRAHPILHFPAVIFIHSVGLRNPSVMLIPPSIFNPFNFTRSNVLLGHRFKPPFVFFQPLTFKIER